MSEQHDTAGPEHAPEWTEEAPPAIEAPPARGRSQRRWLWPALILVVVVIAAVAGAAYWLPLLPQAAPDHHIDDALAQIDQRLGDVTQHQAALEQRLAGIEQRLDAAPPEAQQEQAAALHQLADRLAALEQRSAQAGDPAALAALNDSLQKLAGDVSQLGARVGKLEARGAEAADRSGEEALLLAVGQLRRAIDSGRPFAAEIATVRKLAQARPELDKPLDALAADAATGIPSLSALTQRFTQDVAPALLRAPKPPESEGITDRIMARLRSLVVIHRIGDTHDPIETAVERGGAALQANDLAGAVKALEGLPAPDGTIAQDWLATAKKRLAAGETLDRIDGAIGTRLAAPATAEH